MTTLNNTREKINTFLFAASDKSNLWHYLPEDLHKQIFLQVMEDEYIKTYETDVGQIIADQNDLMLSYVKQFHTADYEFYLEYGMSKKQHADMIKRSVSINNLEILKWLHSHLILIQ